LIGSVGSFSWAADGRILHAAMHDDARERRSPQSSGRPIRAGWQWFPILRQLREPRNSQTAVHIPQSGAGRADTEAMGPSESSDSSGLTGPSDEPIVVPDDARELERDLEAWRREQRWLRRRRRLERWLLIDWLRRRRLIVPVAVLALVVFAIATTIIGVLVPGGTRPSPPPIALALASPQAPVGHVGGLLPDALLVSTSGPTGTRDLRPGVFAVVPGRCQCTVALERLVDAAAINRLTVFLVGGAGERTWLLSTARRLGPTVVPVVDPVGVLTDAYRASPLTVIAVHADGVIAKIIPDFTAATTLGPTLATLRQPGSSAAQVGG